MGGDVITSLENFEPKVPGDIVILNVVFDNDPTRRKKWRPVVVMDFVHQNSSGTVQVVPLSCTSWSDPEAVKIERDASNNLSRDCAAVPSGACSYDVGVLLKKRIHGNVGNSTFSQISEAVGDVNNAMTSPGLPSECC